MFLELPFNVARMVNTNLLIVWLYGGSFFLVQDESEREFYGPELALITFWEFLVAGALAIVGCIALHTGLVGLSVLFFWL